MACASLQAAPSKPAPRAAVAFSPNGALLAVAGYREVTILDTHTGTPKATLTGAPGAVNAVAFSPDGSRVAGAGGLPGQSGEIRIWNVADGKARVLSGLHKDAILTLAWSPDGKTLAAGSYDRLASLWNVATGQGRPMKDHTDAVYGAAFSPDGRLLATVSGDRTLKMWDVASGKRLYTLGESTAELYCVAFHPSGRQVAAGGVDKSLRKWSVTPTAGMLERSAFAHDGALLRVLYTPDGSGVITAGEDRAVKLWDAATLLEKKVLERQPDWPLGLALSADGKRLAVTRYNGSLGLYDAQTGNPLLKLAPEAGKKVSR